jgi:hypothetical protein
MEAGVKEDLTSRVAVERDRLVAVSDSQSEVQMREVRTEVVDSAGTAAEKPCPDERFDGSMEAVPECVRTEV